MNRIATTLSTLLLAAVAAPALAASYCVDTGAELAAALTAAGASNEDDVIRLETGSVTLAAAVVVTVNGELSIVGGYSSGCVLVGSASSRTTINAAPGTQFKLNLRSDDESLLRLRLTGFSAVNIADNLYPSASVTGTVLVQRTAFSANGTGLRITADHHDVRVENSLFTGSVSDGSGTQGAGLTVERTAAGTAAISVEVVNNTAVGNKIGFILSTAGPVNFVPRLDNNVGYGNRVSDLALRLPVRVAYSVWDSQDLSGGGALAAGSINNLDVNPQLDASFQPIEPSSPVINSGDNDTPAGGLPASDYDGGKRLIGSNVDRGAYESAVNDLPTLTVTSTANSGAGTLRQAILDANSSPGSKTIEFTIIGACPRVIALSSALPALTESTVIAGYTQPGSVQNDSARAFDGTLCIALTGGGTVATGLHFDTGAGEEMTVEGIAFYGFTSEGLKITGSGSGFARGNGFGTGANALIAVPEFADAAIRVNGAPGSEIGGTDVAQRNVIARGTQAGIRLEASTDGRSVKNNLIGFTPAGTAALANGIGITVDGSFRDAIAKNLIGFSTTQGIRILNTATPAQETLISQNDIGVAANFADAGNGTNGVRIEGGEAHDVQLNLITNNGTDGLVVLTTSRRVEILNNRISDNALQAIDLSPDGVNPIDLDVGQTGANDQQNYPTLTEAEGTQNVGEVTGTLQSENGTYRIQFFSTPECDADGYGEAQTFAGQVTVQITNAGASSNGSVAFTAGINGPSLFGEFITAIAIDEEGNSSEVSACVPYLPGPLIFKDGFEGDE